MSVIEHTDRKSWDELVARLGGQPFQAWAWGELKAQFGWRPIRLSSADGKSAAQLLIRPYRGLAVAYVPRGPVIAADAQIDTELIEAITSVARKARAAFVRFELDVLDEDPRAQQLHEQLRLAGFGTAERSIQPRSSIRVDLAPPLDKIRAAFSTGRKGRIRTAERDGVTVRVGDKDNDVELLHRTLTATAQRKGDFGIHTAGYYRALVNAFGDDARIFLGEHGGDVVSAQLVLAFGRNGIYLVGSSNAEGLRLHAAHLVQWHAIQWAKERGVTTWDMWGIADARGRLELIEKRGAPVTDGEKAKLEREASTDPLDSLLGFKKGWGGDVVRTVPAYDRVFIAPAYWLWKRRSGEA
jgi:lipid II:glycine glycyltransferase (peptidoglycan interpeptide bridge formation enzyme)